MSKSTQTAPPQAPPRPDLTPPPPSSPSLRAVEGPSLAQAIPIAQISAPKPQARDDEDIEHIHTLASSIATHGLLQPILVAPTPTGYQLIAGYHRLHACKLLGHKTISAVVRPAEDIPDPLSLAATENLHRLNLTLAEEVKICEHLRDNLHCTPKETAKRLGRSVTWVTTRLEIPMLPPDVAERLLSGELSIAQALELAQVHNQAERSQLIWATTQQRLSAADLRDARKALATSPTHDQAVKAGVEEARRLSSAPPPTRPCTACGNTYDLTQLRFVPVCLNCLSAPTPQPPRSTPP
jgi:ParB family chromosome partitioning protein